ncbi:serpin family protein [Ruminococcus sp.]|uniref:serpin family protein n=1 Tax=Ruminococcus sp. TaxID=41978 RepID=UPI0025FC31DB|nr:serpin family protein [Ruminococcus sp.]
MKMFTRITSVLLSASLALGFIDTYPLLQLNNKYIAVAAEQQEYEVEIKNACISKICKEEHSKTIILIPQKSNNYNSFDKIEILLDTPETMGYNPDDKRYKEYFDKWDNTCNYIDQLEEGTIATIKFVTYDQYGANALKDQLAKESGYWGSLSSDDYYYMDYIESVRSLDIHYYGDINDDGVVDSYDVISFRKQLAGNLETKLSEIQFLNGDINCNTEIDEEDLQLIQDYLLGKSKGFHDSSVIGSIRIDNNVDIKEAEGKNTDEKFAAAEMKFGVDLLKKCFDPTKNGEENLLISPLSISTALSMTANGADGETKAEMEKLLGNGLSLEEINDYMAYYIANLPDEKKTKVYLADSIWFKDKPEFKVYDDFLETNKKFFRAQLYKAPFDDSTINDVNGWVNQNTKGMIPSLLKKGDLTPDVEKEILMMLINTLYFENEWQSTYEESIEGKFTDLNGTEHPIKQMFSKEYQYFDLGDADAFKKPYLNGDYSFVGIMPKEKNIIDYVNTLDAQKLFEGLKEYADPDNIELTVMIPKFKYNYSKSLKDVLAAIGMPTAFDKQYADFSKINDTSFDGTPKLYIDDVLHKTKIEVTEKGTKAAAVTSVMMAMSTSIQLEKKKIHIYLDKPFIYMIVDKNNVPLFIGSATQLTDN